MNDNEMIRDAIEWFAVQHFDTIEMSGAVKCNKTDQINYFSVDLTNQKLDEGIEKFHQSLSKYLREWAGKNLSNFDNYVSISRLTVEYILPEKGGANQNQSKHIKLFYLPSYYYQNDRGNQEKTYPTLILKILDYWHNVMLRNTGISIMLTMMLVSFGIYRTQNEPAFIERLTKSYEYINIASGIIASFVLGFLVNKVTNIRQEKLKHTDEIKELSNQLTYFRNICYNLARDHNYWTKENQMYTSYEYANAIKHDITYEEYQYPNYESKVEYAQYKSFYNDKVSHNVVSLVLQLHMMADDSFLSSGLTYTKFPPNYIYKHDEMQQFILFYDSNQIWYCCSEIKIFPNEFLNSYHVKEIVEDIKRIYPKKKIENLTSQLLEEVSLDFQYRIIPHLFNLTSLVELKLPYTIKYFTYTFILLLAFGLIIPTIGYIFFDKSFAFYSVFIVIGIISHILLSLNAIMNAENTLNRKIDFL